MSIYQVWKDYLRHIQVSLQYERIAFIGEVDPSDKSSAEFWLLPMCLAKTLCELRGLLLPTCILALVSSIYVRVYTIKVNFMERRLVKGDYDLFPPLVIPWTLIREEIRIPSSEN